LYLSEDEQLESEKLGSSWSSLGSLLLFFFIELGFDPRRAEPGAALLAVIADF
jgi:hypothetical protein